MAIAPNVDRDPTITPVTSIMYNVHDTTRGGHGIPKCNPCPSAFFLMPPDLSVRFRILFKAASTYVRHMDS